MNVLRRLFYLNTNDPHRIFGLDVVRATAVLLVVLGHSDRMLGQHWDYHPVLKWLFNHLFVFFLDGVDLFFVLSGLLIGSILIKSIEKSNSFTMSDLVYFWKRRWYRTLPNYYLILCINVVVWYGIHKQQQGHFAFNDLWVAQIPKYFLFLQNLNQPCPPFFVESWSLAIEEWFYLLLPIVIFLLSKASFLSKKQVIALSLAIFLVFSTGLRFYKISMVAGSLSPFDAGNLYRTTVLTRLDALMLGVLGAFICQYYPVIWRQMRWVAFGVALVMFYVIRWITPAEHDVLLQQDLLLYGLHPTLLGIAILLLMPLAHSIRQHQGGLIGRGITYISLVSYSMYLVNLLIIKTIQHFVRPFYEVNATVELAEYGLFWMVTVLVSVLLYKYVERPIMNLRK
ncbi:MAG: acyltransferase [Spirosomataceae bacterium]